MRYIEWINEIAVTSLKVRVLELRTDAHARLWTVETTNKKALRKQRAYQVRADKASSPQDETSPPFSDLTTGMVVHIVHRQLSCWGSRRRSSEPSRCLPCDVLKSSTYFDVTISIL